MSSLFVPSASSAKSAVQSPPRNNRVAPTDGNADAASETTRKFHTTAREARSKSSRDEIGRSHLPRGPVRAVSQAEHAAITQQMIDQAIAEGRHSETMHRYCDQCGQQVDSFYSVIVGTRRMICRPCAKKNGVKDA